MGLEVFFIKALIVIIGQQIDFLILFYDVCFIDKERGFIGGGYSSRCIIIKVIYILRVMVERPGTSSYRIMR
ncbi:MAG: hypothetical protein MZV64_14120 [Ignavibacteriales bacterium]|nr:hypothetical protein [Ignavibacteriales bacterium]